MSQFESARMLYKTVSVDDKAFIAIGLSDPQVYKHYGYQITSSEDADNQMRWYESLHLHNKGKWWIMTSKLQNEPIGAIGLSDWDKINRRAEIGFWLIPSHWGMGFAGEAVLKISEVAFREFDIFRLEAFVEAKNEPSARVLIRAGFLKECCFREYEWKNGQFIDIVVYGLVRSDYDD